MKNSKQHSSVHPKKYFIMILQTGIGDQTHFDKVFLSVYARPGNDIMIKSVYFRHRCTHLACHHQ